MDIVVVVLELMHFSQFSLLNGEWGKNVILVWMIVNQLIDGLDDTTITIEA